MSYLHFGFFCLKPINTRHTFSMLVFLHLLATRGILSNHSEDSCEIYVNPRNAKSHTPHCLRATAISSMNDAGFQDRHIMFTRTNNNTVFSFSFFLVFRITLYWQNISKANISNDFIVTFLIITIYENYECPFFGNWKFHRKNQ